MNSIHLYLAFGIITAVNSDLSKSKRFPLKVPEAIRQHFSLRSLNGTGLLGDSVRNPKKHDSTQTTFKISQTNTKTTFGTETFVGDRDDRDISPGVYSCGHQGSDMFINFINPHYPAYDRVSGTCQFRMLLQDPEVCQIRVDFVDTEMLSPKQGKCEDQYLAVSGSIWSTGFGRLCGINPDQHFYIHLDKKNSFKHIDFTITSVTAGIPYKFGLWITQIACEMDSTVMAPSGCTQFYFGSQGSIKTFNFEGVQYLNNQNYKICVKSERGACHAEFRADINQFMLEPIYQKKSSKSRRKVSKSIVSMAGDEGCARDYILIPGGTSHRRHNSTTISKDRYCGGFLNPESGEAEGNSVYTRISSSVLWIQFVSGEPEKGADPLLHGPGVRMRYFQERCAEEDLMN